MRLKWFKTHSDLQLKIRQLESDCKRWESLAQRHYDNWLSDRNMLDDQKDRQLIEISELHQEIKKRDMDIIDLKDLVIAKGLIIDKLRNSEPVKDLEPLFIEMRRAILSGKTHWFQKEIPPLTKYGSDLTERAWKLLPKDEL